MLLFLRRWRKRSLHGLLCLVSPLMVGLASSFGFLSILSAVGIEVSFDDFSLITDEVSHLHSIDAPLRISQSFLRLPNPSGSHSTFVVRLNDAWTTVGTSRDLRDVHRTDTEDFDVGIRRIGEVQSITLLKHFVHHSIGETEEGLK